MKDDTPNENVQGHLVFLKEAGRGYMFIHSSIVHAKFILTDPNTSSAQGLLFTANLTKRALTENNDIAISLSQSQVNDLFQQFLYGFFDKNATEYRYDVETGNSSLQPIKSRPRELEPSQETIWTTEHSKTIAERLDAVIDKISQDDEMCISSWNFVLDNPTSQKLIDKIGAKTRILLSNGNKNLNVIISGLDKGAEVRRHRLQHAKFILTNQIGIVFSANLESQGLEKGFESGVVLTDPNELDTLKQIFNYWYEMAEGIAKKDQVIDNLIGNTGWYFPEENVQSVNERALNPDRRNTATA